MDINEKTIVNMINKCLALGASANRHEAEVAMAKAQALMSKYRITQAMLEEGSRDKDSITQMEFCNVMFLQQEHLLIYGILGAYFNVRGIRMPEGRRVTLTLVGRESELSFAKFAWDYLTRVFADAWEEYRDLNMAPTCEKVDFMVGMQHGIMEHMAKAKREEEEATLTSEQMRNRYGLVVQGDKEAVAKEYARRFPFAGKYNAGGHHCDTSGQAYQEGKAKGRETHVRRPLSGAVAHGGFLK